MLAWDKNTPNPFRDKARTESIDKQIEQIYSGFRDLKAKLVAEKDDLEQKASAGSTTNTSIEYRSCHSLSQASPTNRSKGRAVSGAPLSFDVSLSAGFSECDSFLGEA